MSIQAVIFDIDGTLVDSVDLHAQAWREAFAHFGYDIPVERVRGQIGKGADKLIPYLIGEEDAHRIGEKLDRFRSDLWKRKYFSQVKPFPMVRELFQRILRDGKKIALASSSKGDELLHYKKIAQIEKLVDKETSADDVESSKPSPDVVHAALSHLNHPDPKSTMMVGDTPYDAEAAAKAGVRTIAVLCGGFSKESLLKAGAIAIYRDLSDLFANYDSSPLAEIKTEAA